MIDEHGNYFDDDGGDTLIKLRKRSKPERDAYYAGILFGVHMCKGKLDDFEDLIEKSREVSWLMDEEEETS